MESDEFDFAVEIFNQRRATFNPVATVQRVHRASHFHPGNPRAAFKFKGRCDGSSLIAALQLWDMMNCCGNHLLFMPKFNHCCLSCSELFTAIGVR
jgi:hypothetical protein